MNAKLVVLFFYWVSSSFARSLLANSTSIVTSFKNLNINTEIDDWKKIKDKCPNAYRLFKNFDIDIQTYITTNSYNTTTGICKSNKALILEDSSVKAALLKIQSTVLNGFIQEYNSTLALAASILAAADSFNIQVDELNFEKLSDISVTFARLAKKNIDQIIGSLYYTTLDDADIPNDGNIYKFLGPSEALSFYSTINSKLFILNSYIDALNRSLEEIRVNATYQNYDSIDIVTGKISSIDDAKNEQINTCNTSFPNTDEFKICLLFLSVGIAADADLLSKRKSVISSILNEASLKSSGLKNVINNEFTSMNQVDLSSLKSQLLKLSTPVDSKAVVSANSAAVALRFLDTSTSNGVIISDSNTLIPTDITKNIDQIQLGLCADQKLDAFNNIMNMLITEVSADPSGKKFPYLADYVKETLVNILSFQRLIVTDISSFEIALKSRDDLLSQILKHTDTNAALIEKSYLILNQNTFLDSLSNNPLTNHADGQLKFDGSLYVFAFTETEKIISIARKSTFALYIISSDSKYDLETTILEVADDCNFNNSDCLCQQPASSEISSRVNNMFKFLPKASLDATRLKGNDCDEAVYPVYDIGLNSFCAGDIFNFSNRLLEATDTGADNANNLNVFSNSTIWTSDGVGIAAESYLIGGSNPNERATSDYSFNYTVQVRFEYDNRTMIITYGFTLLVILIVFFY